MGLEPRTGQERTISAIVMTAIRKTGRSVMTENVRRAFRSAFSRDMAEGRCSAGLLRLSRRSQRTPFDLHYLSFSRDSVCCSAVSGT